MAVVVMAIFGKETDKSARIFESCEISGVNYFLNIAATKLAFKLSPKTCSAIYSCKSALEIIFSAQCIIFISIRFVEYQLDRKT